MLVIKLEFYKNGKENEEHINTQMQGFCISNASKRGEIAQRRKENEEHINTQMQGFCISNASKRGEIAQRRYGLTYTKYPCKALQTSNVKCVHLLS